MADRPFSAEPVPLGTRLACRVEYDGSEYNGWQSQPHAGTRTVQDELEAGLSAVADVPVRVHCAGRTDSGVHAFSQIIHFDTPAIRSCKAWVIGGNARLTPAVRLHWALPVNNEFHARFSAQARSYRYVIANTPIRPALLRDQLTWHRDPLDTQMMHSAAQALLGERDFSAFRAASCQSSTPMRCVEAVSVHRRSELVIVEITANAFLHHMVRNITGALLAVGDQRRPVEWIGELMEARDRTRAAATAPATGLYLVDVRYPNHFGLPPTPYGPMLIGANP